MTVAPTIKTIPRVSPVEKKQCYTNAEIAFAGAYYDARSVLLSHIATFHYIVLRYAVFLHEFWSVLKVLQLWNGSYFAKTTLKDLGL